MRFGRRLIVDNSHSGILPRMGDPLDKPRVGEQVILLGFPDGFLHDLPDEDVRAITAMIGRAVTLVDYDEHGRAELEFYDPFDGIPGTWNHTHTIWVAPEFIGPVRS